MILRAEWQIQHVLQFLRKLYPPFLMKFPQARRFQQTDFHPEMAQIEFRGFIVKKDTQIFYFCFVTLVKLIENFISYFLDFQICIPYRDIFGFCNMPGNNPSSFLILN